MGSGHMLGGQVIFFVVRSYVWGSGHMFGVRSYVGGSGHMFEGQVIC